MKMATIPVFKCRACGKPVYVTNLQTTMDDPDGSILRSMMQGLSKVALCDFHARQRAWYAKQGREEEWKNLVFNPQPVILNVLDNTGLDYYGRKD
jgi:hypothetical protein